MHPYRSFEREGALPALPLERVGAFVAIGVAALVVVAAIVAGGANERTAAVATHPTLPVYKVAEVFRLSDETIAAMRGRDVAITGEVREVSKFEVVLRGAAAVPEIDCSLAPESVGASLAPGAHVIVRARLLGRWHDQITAEGCVLLQPGR